ncbi:MAG: hypothetical protein Q9194_002935 [Teloschistes cf. exilis]
MALIAVAESAREVAVGFNKFLDPVPEISTEITALMSECYAISSELQKLDNAKEDQRYYHDYNYIYTDVLCVRQSLECTFDDIIRLFGALGRPGHISRRAAYHQVWREIDSHFYQESGFPLCKRLEYNRLFLKQLNSILNDGCQQAEVFRKEKATRTLHPSTGTPFLVPGRGTKARTRVTSVATWF